MDRSATYLYCVVKATRRPSVARAPRGLPGAAAPAAVELGESLWLIVADVPLDVYGPEPLQSALGDIQWVSDAAVAHDAVVEHFARMASATAIPMKMFTMFSTEVRAVIEMKKRRRELESVVKRIAGCEEWGVRIARTAPAAAQRGTRTEATSGAAFLAAKKQARDEVREAARAAGEAAQQAFQALSAVAKDATRRDDVPQGATTPPLIDAAFLVPAGRRAAFKSAARKAAAACAQAGASMTLTGPWPAYNFVQEGSRP